MTIVGKTSHMNNLFNNDKLLKDLLNANKHVEYDKILYSELNDDELCIHYKYFGEHLKEYFDLFDVLSFIYNKQQINLQDSLDYILLLGIINPDMSKTSSKGIYY